MVNDGLTKLPFSFANLFSCPLIFLLILFTEVLFIVDGKNLNGPDHQTEM